MPGVGAAARQLVAAVEALCLTIPPLEELAEQSAAVELTAVRGGGRPVTRFVRELSQTQVLKRLLIIS